MNTVDHNFIPPELSRSDESHPVAFPTFSIPNFVFLLSLSKMALLINLNHESNVLT